MIRLNNLAYWIARRLARALLVAGGASLIAITASASLLANPVVDSISPGAANPGQHITITGHDFTSGSGGGCTNPPPTVFFAPVNGAATVSTPANGGGCSDNSLDVTVPNFAGGAARIMVQDASFQQHQSNDNFQLTSPAPSASGLSPANGTVDTHTVTVSGSNLLPPTVVSGSNQLSFGGSGHSVKSWGPSAVTFDPGAISGAVTLSMSVHIDANNANATKPVSTNAGSYTFQPPALADLTPNAAAVGSGVTISGVNLGSTAGTVTFTGGPNGQITSWSPSSIGVNVPAGAQNGSLTVHVPGFGPLNGPSISMNPLAQSLSKGSASAGDGLTVSGYNFGADTGTVTVGGTNESITGWAETSVSFNVTAETDGGTVTVTRADGQSSNGPGLSIVPHVTKLNVNNVTPGTVETIEGISFGSETGVIKVGSNQVTPQLWSRTSVLFTIPASVKPGNYQVTLRSAAGALSNALSLTLIAGPPPPSPGATPSPGAKVTPHFDNNHEFVKPIKPPSPVDLTLTADPHKIGVGGTANLTVTLKLNGKPVQGAEIKLSMVSSPGTDYTFTPALGTTDKDGVWKGTVKISKSPGDNVILAQSGVFSDQDAITGTGGSSGPSIFNPASGATGPLLAMGVAAVVLVAGGLFVNLRSHGYI